MFGLVGYTIRLQNDHDPSKHGLTSMDVEQLQAENRALKMQQSQSERVKRELHQQQKQNRQLMDGVKKLHGAVQEFMATMNPFRRKDSEQAKVNEVVEEKKDRESVQEHSVEVPRKHMATQTHRNSMELMEEDHDVHQSVSMENFDHPVCDKKDFVYKSDGIPNDENSPMDDDEDDNDSLGVVWDPNAQSNRRKAIEKELKSILVDSGVIEVLENGWPKIADFVLKNLSGALQVLEPSGYIKSGVFWTQLEVNKTTKSQYNAIAMKALEQIDNNPALAPARRALIETIVRVYLEYAPECPSKIGSKTKVFTYMLDEKGRTPEIPAEDADGSRSIFIWSCHGEINMQNVKMGENQIQTWIWAKNQLRFKAIKLEIDRMHTLENLLQNNQDQVSQAMKQAVRLEAQSMRKLLLD